MIVLFQNSTTFRSENNKSDYEILQANNELSRKKKRLRYGVTAAVGIPLLLIIRFFLYIIGLRSMGYAGYLILGSVCLVIGYLPSEAVVRYVFGNKTGTGDQLSAAKTFKYVFTDEKIMVSCNEDATNIPYSSIDRVTQNPYYYNIFFMGNKYQLDKRGFSVDSHEFEKLMGSQGKTIEVEYENY